MRLTSFALSCTCENVCKSLNIFPTCISSHALDLDHESKVKLAISIHAFPHIYNSSRHTNHIYMIHCIHNQLGQWVFVKVHNNKITSIRCSRVLGKNRKGRGKKKSLAHVQYMNPKNYINMTYSFYIKVVEISNIISSIRKTSSNGESCVFLWLGNSWYKNVFLPYSSPYPKSISILVDQSL